MEQVMALRIFDHLLVNHRWTATGGIYTPATHVAPNPASPPIEITAAERAEIGRRSLLARLTYRCRLDPIMSRTARLLQADPSLSIQRLAAVLGVSEQRLSTSLRSTLGEEPKLGKSDGAS
jgi:hypothetical protein